MKIISFIILSSLVFILFSCGSNQTTNNYSSTTLDNTPKIIIYPITYSTIYDGDNGDIIPNYCFGADSNNYIAAPFYSTSAVDLKNRLPTNKWSNPVYSRQGHIISSSWENLWDGNLDNMSLHDAEVIYEDDTSTSEIGYWTGTKSNGTYSGNNCNDWSSDTSTDRGTWGSFLSKSSSWIYKGTISCSNSKYYLCFKYN